jgi:2-isopropylmalate synthase
MSMCRRRRWATAATSSSPTRPALQRAGGAGARRHQCRKDDPRVARLLDEVKEREALGYAYEGADASFFLLAKRVLGEVPAYFKVERFKVNVERATTPWASSSPSPRPLVKVKVGDEVMISAAEGNGPVNALDVALRKDLGRYQRFIEDLKLVDFRVRILNGRHRAP